MNGQALPRLGDDAALVCVVDDDEDVRKGLVRLFRSIGLAVETFPSPQAFLARPLADRPSCLVLDVQLSGQSGLELVVTGMLNKHVAGALGAAEKTVFITAHDDAGTCERAQKAPTTEYLSKPFEDQSLLGAIHQAIRGASGRGEDAP